VFKMIIFLACLIMSTQVYATPWYRGLYGHFSGGMPMELGRISTDRQLDASHNELESKKESLSLEVEHLKNKLLQKGLHVDSRIDASKVYWLGGGYRFLKGHALELSYIYLSSDAHCTIDRSMSLIGDTHLLSLKKRESQTTLSGIMLMGKGSSRVFRIFDFQPNKRQVFFVPDSVKTDKVIEGYVKEKASLGLLHEFSFYIQAGCGLLSGNQSTTVKNVVLRSRSTGKLAGEDVAIPLTLTFAIGLGAQYHFNAHVNIDGSWAYMMPTWPANSVVNSFYLFKVGFNIYL
jgi:opacity protein-like surface antigen